MRSPILWFGGKGNMVAKLLPLIKEIQHHTYVEPFGGGASLLLAKPPSPVEVYNDLDQGLVGFFRVLRDPVQFAEFHRLVSLTQYSRAEYYHARDTWATEDDPVQRAYLWYVTARQSFSGCFGSSWSLAVTCSGRGMACTASKWLSAVERLPEVVERLLRVQVECHDWRQILDTYDRPGTLFYLDPPYVMSTRSAGGYAHELTADDHRELVERLPDLSGQWVLSGYESPLY